MCLAPKTNSLAVWPIRDPGGETGGLIWRNQVVPPCSLMRVVQDQTPIQWVESLFEARMLRLKQSQRRFTQIQFVINRGHHRGSRRWHALGLFLAQLLVHLNLSKSGLFMPRLLLLCVDWWEMKSVLRFEFRGVRAVYLWIFLQLPDRKNWALRNLILLVIPYKLIIIWCLLMSISRSARLPSNFIESCENTPGNIYAWFIPKN